MFNQSVIEQIGYYVYYLVDPRSNVTFYVGKGLGNRVFQHVDAAISNPSITDKISLINEIRENGFEVNHNILRHGLTEEQALEVEAAVIDYIGLDNLTNEVLGYSSYRGKMKAEEIISTYSAREVVVTEPVLFININKAYRRDFKPEELYEATNGWWVLSKKRCEKVKYVFSIYKNLMMSNTTPYLKIMCLH